MHEVRLEQQFPLTYDFVHPGYYHYIKLASTFAFTKKRKLKPQRSENLKEVYARYCFKIHSKIHINFNELMNFVFWWSCIKKGSQSPGLTFFFIYC